MDNTWRLQKQWPVMKARKNVFCTTAFSRLQPRRFEISNFLRIAISSNRWSGSVVRVSDPALMLPPRIHVTVASTGLVSLNIHPDKLNDHTASHTRIQRSDSDT